jgi:hypothetical protein
MFRLFRFPRAQLNEAAVYAGQRDCGSSDRSDQQASSGYQIRS